MTAARLAAAPPGTWGRLVLLAGLVAATAWLTAAPAGAAACTGDDGVTVVVDSTAVGGGIRVACAPGDPASGLAALTAAGFGVDEVASQAGFVCRIDGAPSDQGCQQTPPADAYWGYWHAERGGSWSYSRAGAGSRDPAPGSVEGWAFTTGGGAPTAPGVAPPAPPPPPAPPSPEPAPSPTASTPPGGGGSGGGGSGGVGADAGGSGGGSAGGDTGGDGSDDGSSSGSSDAGDDSATAAGDDARAAEESDGTARATDDDRSRDDATATGSGATASSSPSPTADARDDRGDVRSSSAADGASATPSGAATTSADDRGSTPDETLTASPARAEGEGGTSWLPTLLTVGIVAAMGAAAVVVQRRRGVGRSIR